jgi:hypothetical protein
LAALPQQEFSAAASAWVPQQVPLDAGSGSVSVDRAGLPQQPLVPETVRASAGSPAKPPLVSLMIELLLVSRVIELDVCRNRGLHAD